MRRLIKVKKINIERLCIVLSIAIVLFGAGVHLYRWWRVSSLEAQARAAEEKAAELAKKAEEAAAKKEEEEKAQLAQETEKVLEPLIAAIPQENQEDAKAIVEVLVAINKAQNNTDYRTVTGLEGIEYMTEKYKQQTIAEADKLVEKYKQNQVTWKFKGIRIQELNISEDKKNAEITYDTTAERSTPESSETITVRFKAFLVKENNKWLVNNEEILGRVE